MAKVNPDVALKERQVHEICYHTSLKTHGWWKLRNSPNVNSSFRVNIAVSCLKNSCFTKVSRLFLQHRGKPEVLKETWVEQFNVHGSGLKSANRLISIRMMPQ